MPIAIGMEQQVQVRGSDGSILWVGAAIVGVMYHILNTNGLTGGLNADGKMAFGEGIRFNATNTITNNLVSTNVGTIPRSETTAAAASPAADLPMSVVLGGLSIITTGELNHLGVALETIGRGKIGLIAGVGSILTVLTTTVTLALGTTVGSSATAGLAAANTTPTQILGTVMKINTGTPAANTATGTQSTSHAGILVMPR